MPRLSSSRVLASPWKNARYDHFSAIKFFMRNANMMISASFTPKHINLVCIHLGMSQFSGMPFAHSA